MRHTLHAEWTKARTVPGLFWLLGAVVLVTAGVGAAACAGSWCVAPGCDAAKVSLTGVLLGQTLVAVLAVLLVSGEYSTGMIRVTLAAVPRRATVLAAKATILTGGTLLAGTVAVLGSVLAGRLLLPGHGYPALSLGDGPVLRAAAGSVLYLALIGLLSLGTAVLVRDPAVSIGTVLGLLYLFPIVAQLTGNPHWRRHLQQIGPMTAGLAVQVTTGLRELPIGPWAGLGVLACWAAGALLGGVLVLWLRDA